MRRFVLITIALMLVATGAFSASITTGTIKMLGGGADSVGHCRVLDYDVAASDTISSVNANVECDLGGSYTIEVTVNSGASTTGQTAASLTANTPQVVAVTISPSVSISGATYNVDVRVKN